MNTLEIITEMRQNPSLAEELRAVVLSERLLELPEKVASMDDKLEKLIEISKRHESRLSRIEKIAERYGNDIGQLKGGYFESQWREKATAYLASRGFRQVHLINRGDLDSLLTKAGAEDDFRCDILLADAVHSAIGKDDKVSVYIVAEVSSRIDVNDIERSLRRAELLGQATGKVCVACAVGASIDELAQKLAVQKNVVVVTPTEWNTQTA